MPTLNLLRPFRSKHFGLPQAKHLANRATFGLTLDQTKQLQEMGLSQAVDYLVNYQQISDADLPTITSNPDITKPMTKEQRQKLQQARKDKDAKTLRLVQAKQQLHRMDEIEQTERQTQWWLERMIATPRPLEEKLTLLWHNHFSSKQRNVKDSYLMLQQNKLFRKHANGSFAEMAYDIIRDPAMLRFLNNDVNRKQKPNENLARELMELFTLGEGHYSEQDIKQGARALTGYSVNDNDFAFHQYAHDPENKVILGQIGDFNGEDFVTLLLKQKNCSKFIASKLYKTFVADIDGRTLPLAQSVIRELSFILKDNDYQIKPTLRTLFQSQYFYRSSVIGNKIKSPAQLLTGTIRTYQTPIRDLALLQDAMEIMGQALFDPPSVAGWAGGRDWISTSSMFARQNITTYLLTGKQPYQDQWAKTDIHYDPMPLVLDLSSLTNETMVDRLLDISLASPAAPQRRRVLLDFLDNKGSTKITGDTLIALQLLITSMPEYQLC